jgi:hypothetical protein
MRTDGRFKYDRKIARFLAPEDTIDILRRFAHCIFEVETVGDESPGLHGHGSCEE